MIFLVSSFPDERSVACAATIKRKSIICCAVISLEGGTVRKYYAERRGAVKPEPLNFETLKKFFLFKFEELEKDLYFREATGFKCVEREAIKGARAVRAHSKEIFGENSVYFDVKHIMKTASGIGSIPDAYVITLSEPGRLYVVENELATHPLYDHIVKQLTKFINGIGYQNAKNQITDMLYDQINGNNALRQKVQEIVGSTDVYRFLSKLLAEQPRIVIIIDKKTDELEEACYSLRYQPDIIEFKTYVREDNQSIRAHLFEPIHPIENGGTDTNYENWEKKLAKSNSDLRAIVKELEERIFKLGKISTIQRTRKAYARAG